MSDSITIMHDGRSVETTLEELTETGGRLMADAFEGMPDKKKKITSKVTGTTGVTYEDDLPAIGDREAFELDYQVASIMKKTDADGALEYVVTYKVI